MIEVLFTALVVILLVYVGLPIFAYMLVKFAVAGYLRAVQHQRDKNKNKQSEKKHE